VLYQGRRSEWHLLLDHLPYGTNTGVEFSMQVGWDLVIDPNPPRYAITTCSSREFDAAVVGTSFWNSFDGPKDAILVTGKEDARCEGETSEGRIKRWEWGQGYGASRFVVQHIDQPHQVSRLLNDFMWQWCCTTSIHWCSISLASLSLSSSIHLYPSLRLSLPRISHLLPSHQYCIFRTIKRVQKDVPHHSCSKLLLEQVVIAYLEG